MSVQIMFQSFKWDATNNGRIGQWYKLLETKVDDLVSSKINLVWFPPVSKSREQDFMGYTPMDYYDVGEYRQWVQKWDDTIKKLEWLQHPGAETLFGNKNELVGLIKKFKANKIKCVADIVINHRDPQQVNAQDEWICWGSDEHTIASNKMVWGYKGRDDNPEQIDYLVGGSGYDDGEGGFASNIAHTDPKARKDIKDWLMWMKDDIGFEGWRYDYVKGYDGSHLGEYNYHTGNLFSVGEYLDGDTQKIYNWIDETDAFDVNKKSSAFDFPLKWHLNKIFWGEKPFRELGLWKNSNTSIAGGWPEKSVTFLENHDTASTPYQDFPKDEKRLLQGYVFLLTHPGVPCIFWSHFYELNQNIHDTIKNLCNFRSKANLGNASNVVILKSEDACYAALINDSVIVKIGDDFWSPFGMEGNWNMVLSGNGWAIWEK